MFRRLRAEEPVSWHEVPGAKGFWSFSRHADVVTINRDSKLFSSEAEGVVGLYNPDELPTTGDVGGDPRGLMMLYTDPPRHTRYRLLVNKGFTPRMIGLLEQYLKHRAVLIVDNVIDRGSADFVTEVASELPLAGHRRDHGRPPGRSKAHFRLVQPHDRDRRPRVRQRRRVDGLHRAVHLRQRTGQAASQRSTRGHRHQADQRRDRRRSAERTRVRHVHAALVGGRQRDHPQRHGVGHVGLMQNPDAYAALVRGSVQARRSRRSKFCAGPRRCCTSAAPPQRTPRSAARPSPRTTRSSCGTSRPTGTKRCSTTRSPSTSSGPESPYRLRRWGSPLLSRCQSGPHGAAPHVRRDRAAHPRHAHDGEPQFLRSNFIGGIKHIPVAFTPGAHVNPAPLAASTV